MGLDKPFGGVRRFTAGEGVELNAFEAGDAGPPVIFVHGYPDTHAVWLPTMARLVDDFRCLAYDVRGAGCSTVPSAVEGYRLHHLIDDLVVVADAFSPDQPFHLVGHDWGSVQAWQAVLRSALDPRLAGRIASYTTISGPSLGQLGAWVRSSARGGWGQRRNLLKQVSRSWYIAAFQVPWLPEAVLRRALSDPASARRFLGSGHAAPSVVDDAVNGLGLYRANPGHSSRESSPDSTNRTPLGTDIPVQLIVALRDAFLTPAVYDDLPQQCPNLTRHDVDAGHWVMSSHPDEVAAWIAEFVLAHPAQPGD